CWDASPPRRRRGWTWPATASFFRPSWSRQSRTSGSPRRGAARGARGAADRGAALLPLPLAGPGAGDRAERPGRADLQAGEAGRGPPDHADAAAGLRLPLRPARARPGAPKLMRHSHIGITMDYYANVDDAVERAVRERPRNSSRNSGPVEDPGETGAADA